MLGHIFAGGLIYQPTAVCRRPLRHPANLWVATPRTGECASTDTGAHTLRHPNNVTLRTTSRKNLQNVTKLRYRCYYKRKSKYNWQSIFLHKYTAHADVHVVVHATRMCQKQALWTSTSNGASCYTSRSERYDASARMFTGS